VGGVRGARDILAWNVRGSGEEGRGERARARAHTQVRTRVHARTDMVKAWGGRRRGWKGKNDIYKTQGHKCDCDGRVGEDALT